MKKFGLIGYPLGHSFSKKYFTEKFFELGLTDYQYEIYPIESIDKLAGVLENEPDLVGFNVTIPYKESVIPFLHTLSPIVQSIGACNCVHIKQGRLSGFNTDVIGFQRSIQSSFPDLPSKALILGTGGASKAVKHVMESLNITYRFVSRKSSADAYSYEELTPEIVKTHQLIVNTTPLGLYPHIHEAPNIPYEAIGESHCLFDLVYNPAVTMFLEKGKKQGAQIQNGLDMLIIQAEESWKIWNELQ